MAADRLKLVPSYDLGTQDFKVMGPCGSKTLSSALKNLHLDYSSTDKISWLPFLYQEQEVEMAVGLADRHESSLSLNVNQSLLKSGS